MSKISLDSLELLIIEAYIENPQITQTQISVNIGVGKSTINNRITRLKKCGILLSDTSVNLEAVFPHSIHRVYVKTKHGSNSEIQDILECCKNLPFVIEVRHTEGTYDLVIYYIAYLTPVDDAIRKRTALCNCKSIKKAMRVRVSNKPLLEMKTEYLLLLSRERNRLLQK